MPKCRMCSQEVHSRGRLCQECEWEAESARAWAEASEARDLRDAAASVATDASELDPAATPSSTLADRSDAATPLAPHPGVAPPPDVLRDAAETSYNLWRTRRGAMLLLAISGSAVLVGFAALGPATQPAQAHRSVMVREPGMLPHCSDAASATTCLPSPPP